MSNSFSIQGSVKTLFDQTFRSSRRPTARARLSDALHLFVLTSFALAQPVYDRLGGRSAFLLDQNVTPQTVNLLVFLLSFALPAAIVSFEYVIFRWKPKIYDSLHAIMIFTLLVLLALPVCMRANFLSGFMMLSAGLAAGGFGLWCYFEFRRVRMIVTLAAPGILIFPTVFLVQYSAATAMTAPSVVRSASWAPVPVVLLVFDEFSGLSLMNPEREIDADRFPNFAALSKRSTWFRNAASVNPLTRLAVPAILSGKYPESDKAPGPVDVPQNLFSVLTSAGGYELAAFEPITTLAPRSLALTGQRPVGAWQQTLFLADILWRVYLFQITPPDYHVHLPKISKAWFGWNDSKRIDRTQTRGRFSYGWSDQRDDQFQHFLRCIDDSPRPAFYFGHFLLPHMPWCYLPSGHRHTEDSELGGIQCLETDGPGRSESDHDEFAVIQSQQRYLLQLMYVDHLIGQLLSRLEETGVLDRSLLIVTADHGISFRIKQPKRWLTPDTQADILSVPLFVKLPFQNTGQISDRAVESVDILPTVADVVGLQLQAPTDGWSLFETSHAQRKHLTVFDGGETRHFDPQIFQLSTMPDLLRQRFGNGSDRDAMFRIGPMPELVGQSVQSLPQGTEPRVEIELLRDHIEVADTPNADRPCYIAGTIVSSNSAEESVVLAIAINGTIHAVTRTSQQTSSATRWSGMVPEWVFHAGQNDVRVYSVSGPDRRLVPCLVRDRPK